MTNNNYLPTTYQQFIHASRYARFVESEKRIETWDETVSRYFDFMQSHLKENNKYTLTKELRADLENAVLSLGIMPSMRALMTAGNALSKDHTAGYNCSYIPINDVRSFDEIMYILMCGTGVGFSVERDYVEQLPTIAEEFEDSDTVVVVQDSRTGWAKSLRELLGMLYGGQVPKIDVTLSLIHI